MSEGFIHSIKVPRLYKTASNIVKKVTQDAASLKELIYSQKHQNVNALYALTATTLQHASQLDELINNTQLLTKETRLDPWLARVLICELIWGKQCLMSESKPVLTLKNYENQLREEFRIINQTSTDLLIKNKVKKPRFVRINTLKITVSEAIQGFKEDGYTQLPKAKNYQAFLESLKNLGTWEFIQDFHIPELIAFAPGTKFFGHSLYHDSSVLLQDKASCLPAFLLNPMPGSVVLDTCAAPGMKTTHLAAIMNNEGQIYAVEKNDRRYLTLCNFIESTKTYIVTPIHDNASNLYSKDCPDVKYILVDPSCSGSGMDRPEFDKNSPQCDPKRLKSLQSFQVFMLRHALLNFPKAEKVVYSTCSIYPEENEMVIDEVLRDIGNSWTLIPARRLLHDEWNHYSSTEFKCKDNCLYAKPDEDLTGGFFVAIFTRNFDVPLPESIKNKMNSKNKQAQEKTDHNLGKGLNKNKKKNKDSINEEEFVEESNEERELEAAGEKEDYGENRLDKESKKNKKKKRKNSVGETDEQLLETEGDVGTINMEVNRGKKIIEEKNDDLPKKKKKKKNVDE